MQSLSENKPSEIVVSKIEEQFNYFSRHPLLLKLIDAISAPVLILNKNRQVVYSNQALLNITGKTDIDVFFGLLPGDIFGCSHAYQNPGSCGTTEFCSTCGALKSIISATDPVERVQECRIIKTDNEALDLRVTSSPLKIDEVEFTIFTITDISDEKRRKNLERIFFHDLLNTASTLKALSVNLETASTSEAKEFRDHLVTLSDNLVDEICAQRDIYAAENNDLAVYLSRCRTFDLLNDLNDQFSYYKDKKKIIIDPSSEDLDFFTDKVLMRRILFNMIKNAIEATSDFGTITISCMKKGKNIQFRVHNQNYMEKDIQLQIFQRSFSTKGHGRGIGTYSMKLLCENYLKGKITFTSSLKGGTSFYCSVPQNYD